MAFGLIALAAISLLEIWNPIIQWFWYPRTHKLEQAAEGIVRMYSMQRRFVSLAPASLLIPSLLTLTRASLYS